MSRKFQRTIEDFVCENCQTKVQGNGYTDYCPHCLCSKHVDLNPGDRANPCQGLMQPIDAFFEKQTWRLVHQCQKCGQTKNITLQDDVNLEKIAQLKERAIKE